MPVVTGETRIAAGKMKDVDLDLLATHWREALDAAEDSLGALGQSRPTLPPAELRNRMNGLQDERGRIELDLEELARMTNTHLHRHVRGDPVVPESR
jgi:hypothetical protein